MWFWKTSIAAEQFGSDMVADLIDVEACRDDVRVLRDHGVPENIALCEMAFARAGLMQAIFEDELRQPVADRAIQAPTKFCLMLSKVKARRTRLVFTNRASSMQCATECTFIVGRHFRCLNWRHL
ncbi:hypothetical protein [Rhizobium sp. Root482]|uniref:hypothetical protein n=1 Tax=Rhizobium sp. Root482 TaxID=1736543 RepID=UPI0006F1DCB8|nr:hypothetical protein [Rhizobium sp. Root482]KQY20294.1 hypothetical protein ASD31_24100 [Rhizobium sp. Root482]